MIILIKIFSILNIHIDLINKYQRISIYLLVLLNFRSYLAENCCHGSWNLHHSVPICLKPRHYDLESNLMKSFHIDALIINDVLV